MVLKLYSPTLNQRVRGSSIGIPSEESFRMYKGKALNEMIQGFCVIRTLSSLEISFTSLYSSGAEVSSAYLSYKMQRGKTYNLYFVLEYYLQYLSFYDFIVFDKKECKYNDYHLYFSIYYLQRNKLDIVQHYKLDIAQHNKLDIVQHNKLDIVQKKP